MNRQQYGSIICSQSTNLQLDAKNNNAKENNRPNAVKALCVILVAFTVFLAAFPVAAQTPHDAGGLTTLSVNVVVQRQEIVTGPYARYAQKYLGVTAPLADKIIYEVAKVTVLDNSEIPYYSEYSENRVLPHMNPESGFPRLTVDKTAAAALSLEENARLAAEKIFEIRRIRLDLISGEVGENVFGGGLSSALAELSRLEEEYLSLFLGKQSVRFDEKQYRVTPIKNKATYTVCRFSPTDGLLSADDLSGVPMVLELKPADESVADMPETKGKPSSRAVPVLVPAYMQCRIILDGTELTSGVFDIRQLARTVYM